MFYIARNARIEYLSMLGIDVIDTESFRCFTFAYAPGSTLRARVLCYKNNNTVFIVDNDADAEESLMIMHDGRTFTAFYLESRVPSFEDLPKYPHEVDQQACSRIVTKIVANGPHRILF